MLQNLINRMNLRQIFKISLCLLPFAVSGCSALRADGQSFQRLDDYSLALMPLQELRANAQGWEQAHRKNPSDAFSAVAYSQHLRHLGEASAALDVMRMTTIADDSQPEVLKEYAKTLLGTGNFQLALSTFERARSPVKPDWDLLNQMGVTLDHLNQFNKAQQLYAKALELRPNEPRIIANQGMSYALSGNLQAAMQALETARQHPYATAKIRENYKLIRGLYAQQGRGGVPQKSQNFAAYPNTSQQTGYEANRQAPISALDQYANSAYSSYFTRNIFGVMDAFELIK